jgi:hypothetical protein
LVVPSLVARWADPEILRLAELAQRVDMSGFEAGYRADGVGGVPYDPRLMLVTVWWCYRQQLRSPQQIACQCREQVSLRVLWQRERVPSASAVRRFITGHPEGWQTVAVSLLALGERAGVVDVSLTATDSTPVVAPAALSKTRTAPRITVMIAEAEQELAVLRDRIAALAEGDVDGFVEAGCGPLYRSEQLLLVRLTRLRAAEDLARQRRSELADRGEGPLGARRRLQARVDKHQADLDAMIDAQQHAVNVYDDKVAAGRKPRGPAPRPPEQHPRIRAKTAILHRAQARLTAAGTDGEDDDHLRRGPRAQANITDPDSRILKGKNTVRWVLGRLLTITVTIGQFILAGLLSPAGNDAPGLLPNLHAATVNCRAAQITQPFGHHLADTGFACTDVFTHSTAPGGGTLLVAVTNEHHQTSHPPDTTTEGRRQMAARLATHEGHHLYTRRAAMVEPVFAHLLRLDRHLHHRGRTAQQNETLALITAYNATKILNAHQKPPTRTRP